MRICEQIRQFAFRSYVRFWEFFGWGYWAFYPESDRLIWSKKQCRIYGEPCDAKLKVAGYAMFNKAVFDESFREYARHVVEMSRRSGRGFKHQFVIRHGITQEVMFIEATGKWVFRKDGTPYCLHGFNRKMEFDNFQHKFDELTLRKILAEWVRADKVPASFMSHGTARK